MASPVAAAPAEAVPAPPPRPELPLPAQVSIGPVPAHRSVSWKRDIQPYFANYCASSRGCHGNNPTKNVDLDLRPLTAYAHLVGVPSDERTGWKRVAPRDPDRSFVVAKMRGQVRDKEGTAMPRDPDDNRPMKPIPFDPDFIDNALVPWIAQGAREN